MLGEQSAEAVRPETQQPGKSALERIASRVRCILWEADIEKELSGKLKWSVTLADETAAERFMPLDREGGESYTEAWVRCRLAQDVDRDNDHATERILAGQSYTTEYRCRLRDGDSTWIREDVDVETVGRNRWRAVGVCVDVTAQKRAQLGRAQLVHVMEAATDMVFTADADGRFLYLNPAGRQMLGIPDGADVSRWRISDGYPDWAAQVFQDQAIPHATKVGSWQGETAILTADGQEIPVSQVVTAHRSPEGRLKFISSIARNITERKRAEDALREAEARFRVMSEASPVGIFLTDPSGFMLYANPEALRQFGGGALAAAWMQSVHADDRAAVMEEWTSAIGEGRQFESIQRFPHHGGVVWSHVSAAPVREGDLVVGYVGIASDITRRRELEDQLRQSQKMEAVGRLAGGVAHDFNNMLAVINGYSDLLLRRLDASAPTFTPLYEIRQAGERAAALTRQLLAYSRRQMLQPRQFDLNEVVTNLNRMLNRLIGEDVELVSQPAAGQVCVVADPGQVEQVVVNLVVNARDAMPEGGQVIIRVDEVDLDEATLPPGSELAPGGYARVEVEDMGTGMTPEVLDQVFEPFFTTKPLGEGTGLGLSTVYGIVKQSGGHIEIQTEIGKGSTFRVYLPRVESEFGAPAEKRPEPLAAGEGVILLVEDEDMVRGLTLTVLRMSGYTVHAARNGEEALKICEDLGGRIDLVVSDVVMPKLGGREMMERILETSPGMRVLFMTGYADDRFIRENMPEAALIRKPFTPAALTEKVREMLG